MTTEKPNQAQTEAIATIAIKSDLSFPQKLIALEKMLGCTSEQAASLFADFYGLQWATVKGINTLQATFDLASFSECQRRGAILCSIVNKGPDGLPVAESELVDAEERHPSTVVLLTANPERLELHQFFEPILSRLGDEVCIERWLVSEVDFQIFLTESGKHLRAMDIEHENEEELPEDDEEEGRILELSLAKIESTSNGVVRIVDSTLYDALNLGASDIHFEVQNRSLTIKYRLDGVLQKIRAIEGQETASQIVSRIKVLADLDISERRIPQDGRFRARLEQRDVDFRVSIMPNINSEDAVLRILDRKHLTGQFQSLTLDSLKFDQDIKSFVRQASNLPYGMLLVTGPTGSGKTTTLYAALSEINTGLDKIVTIEDPIEYQLPGVLQIPVNEKKGLTFAKGLRSTLRHDPDKIMVGEIRDNETAQIAVQAALTGHQVFTTVHANNVFDVIGRFANMGVDSYSLVSALSGILAQRLMRSVCPHCCSKHVPSSQELELLGLSEATSSPNMFDNLKKANGCPECRGTGYKGRTAIAETLSIDDDMRDLLVQQASITSIKKAARDKGFQSLRDNAIAVALRGETTLDEVNRVTPPL